jgi:GGDEF domain-containing protein
LIVPGGLAAKLGALVAALAFAATAAGVYHGYRTSRDLLVVRAEEDMTAAVRVLARSVRLALLMAERDARMLANAPSAARALSAMAPAAQGTAIGVMHEWFEAVLVTRPNYTQVRLISATTGGPEVVRVDRTANGTVRVLGEELQEKGHYPYVYEAQQRAAGQVYLSTISLNREEGAHGAEDRPTLRVAAPVAQDDGVVIGVLVINIDMGGLFELLRADLPPTVRVYMANRQGDYLIHPDTRRTFGFDSGRRYLVQSDFPVATQVLESPQETAVGYGREAGSSGEALVAAFARLSIGDPGESRFMVLGLARTHAHIVDATRDIAIGAWKQIALATLLAGAVGWLIARRISRPLRSMTDAAHAFAHDQPMLALPTHRDDEVGELGRALYAMQQQVQSRMTELRDGRETAERLATHDALTGMPNRRLFLELLEGAMTKARRSHRIFALMLIELAPVKPDTAEIRHGTGGDANPSNQAQSPANTSKPADSDRTQGLREALLPSIAGRLRGSVREIDVAARVSSHQFALLCDGFDEPAYAETIAAKVRQSIVRPVTLDQMTLTPVAHIGVAVYPRDGTSVGALLEAAESALLRARGGGANT